MDRNGTRRGNAGQGPRPRPTARGPLQSSPPLFSTSASAGGLPQRSTSSHGKVGDTEVCDNDESNTQLRLSFQALLRTQEQLQQQAQGRQSSPHQLLKEVTVQDSSILLRVSKVCSVKSKAQNYNCTAASTIRLSMQKICSSDPTCSHRESPEIQVYEVGLNRLYSYASVHRRVLKVCCNAWDVIAGPSS